MSPDFQTIIEFILANEGCATRDHLISQCNRLGLSSRGAFTAALTTMMDQEIVTYYMVNGTVPAYILVD
jgi:hypothetical protein